METDSITMLREQPLVTDLSEEYFDEGGAVQRYEYCICWDGEQIRNRWGDIVWRYKTVRVHEPLSYDAVTRAIVRSRYSADEVEAILLNVQPSATAAAYKSEEYQRELHSLQEWRALAKQIAGQVMAAAKPNTVQSNGSVPNAAKSNEAGLVAAGLVTADNE